MSQIHTTYHKTYFFLLLLCLSYTYNISAQNENVIDSLESKLKQELPDTTRLTVLNELSFQYCFANPNKTFQYVQIALDLSRKLGNQQAEGNAYFNQGIAYSLKGKQDSAEVSMKDALAKYQNINDSLSQSKALNGLGNIYRFQSNLPVALDFFLRSLKIKESLYANKKIDQREIAGSYIGIGSVYAILEEHPLAIEFFQKALDVFEKLQNQKGIAAAATNLSFSYQAIKEHEKALEILQKALIAEEKGGNKDGMAKVLNNLGNTHFALEKYDEAAKYHEQALQVMDEANQDIEKATPLLSLAKIAFKNKENNKALELAQNAVILAEKGKMKNVLSNIHQLLAQIYESQNNFKQAFINYQTYISLRDTILSDKNQKKIIQLETQYEYEKREKQLKLEQAQVEYQLQQRNQRNLYIVYGLILVAIFVGIFAVFYYRYSKQLRQLNATKDKLFTIIAHDLKNPLSAFRSITQSLSSNLNLISKDEIQYFLEKLNNSSYQLYELLQNLLQWAISQSGQLDYQPKELPLSELGQEIMSQLETNSELKKQELINLIPDQTQAWGDIKMTKLVLRNLISNAIKFTPEQGKIELSAIDKGNKVEISVLDNGPGISPVDLNKLFKIEEDNRLIGQSAEKGTGLGLILCRELVERQHGTISVESTLNQGSRFTFSLPKTKNS